MAPTLPAPQPKPPFAWQPLTFAGIAAFATARAGRLYLVKLIFALIVAGTTVWFVAGTWFPVVQKAVEALPDTGEFQAGQLVWPGVSPAPLAESPFLAISVDLDHSGHARSPADIYLEFGRTDLRVYSLFGFVPVPYPGSWSTGFNREVLKPWWGAWAPAILAILALVMMVTLLTSWAMLATLCAPLVWLLAFFANRALTLRGSWRLAGAALLPGALFVCATVVLYQLRALDVILVLLLFGAHFLVGWVYAVMGTLSLPLLPEVAALRSNPFTRPLPSTDPPAEPAAPAEEKIN
jgi:hypothetical protein